jgi:hypothetical protein
MDLGDIDVYENVKNEEDENLNVETINPNQLPQEIQDNDIEILPDIKTRSYIDYPYLKELTENDFDLETYTLIDLKRKNIKGEEINEGNWIILFMDESKNGKIYLQRFLEIAQILKNNYCKIGYVNLSFEKKIFKNFRELSDIKQINNPMSWAKITNIPFIMVYRERWASGFYNQELNQENLADFIINKVSNALSLIDKTANKLNNYKSQIINSEKNIERQALLERAKEQDNKEKEKIKEIDTRKQVISSSVNFSE